MLAFNLALNKRQGEFVRNEKTAFTTCPHVKMQGRLFRSGIEKMTEMLLLIMSKAIYNNTHIK